MKKTSILMAMFTVITTALVANAHSVIDFDRGTFMNSSFMEAVRAQKGQDNSTPTCMEASPAQARTAAVNPAHAIDGTTKMYNLDGAGRRDLRTLKIPYDMFNDKTAGLI